MTRSVELELHDATGARSGKLRISLLPRDSESLEPPPLLDRRAEAPELLDGLEPVQLLEGREYLFELEAVTQGGNGVLSTDRPEVFEPDIASGRRGRCRPGLHTGRLPVSIYRDGSLLGRVAFEVRSRKLDYVRHYRWMLRDVAESLTEVVMERFAATEGRFVPDEQRGASTLYAQFEWLRSLLGSEDFASAVQRVLQRPFADWGEEIEWRPSGRGVSVSSRAGRALNRPGRRRISPELGRSLPEELPVVRARANLDNAPNRFVKFALTRWRAAAFQLGQVLERERETAPVQRGLLEVKAVVARLDAWLSAPLFREVGELDRFPGGNPVLLRREGYRELFGAFARFEAASRLSWQVGEERFGGGLRNVATLYEYWCFFTLAKVVARAGGVQLDLRTLVEVRPDGLAVALARGEQQVVRGSSSRLGRTLALELWFNRTFAPDDERASSWTRPMRPDLSLRVSVSGSGPELPPVWLHFDAKYRVEQLAEVIGTPDEVVSRDLDTAMPGEAKRDDLLKMHAYRDAIRRSAGAYVLYPGSQAEDFRAYHELLPGLGAFALQPTEAGPARGEEALARFLSDVLTHLASPYTQHERERYWSREVHDLRFLPTRLESPVPALGAKPPADTMVLIGYVKNAEHLSWIERERLYNLRADEREGRVPLGSRELSADYVLLDGPSLDRPRLWSLKDPPELATRARLLSSKYPEPGGELYFCLRLDQPLPSTNAEVFARDQLERVRQRFASERPFGAPFVVSWFDLSQ
jgi:predicted component of viral defense system (DUF524 family)